MAEIRIHDGPLRDGHRNTSEQNNWLNRGLQAFLAERSRPELRRLQSSRHQAWSRLLEHNPHTQPGNPPYVWLAERKEANSFVPCGVLLGVPFQLQWGFQTLPGHWGVDLYVPPSARGLGIGRKLLSRWRDLSPLALGLGITDGAFSIELSLGWQDVKVPPHWAFPLTFRGHALVERTVSRRLLKLPALLPFPTGWSWRIYPRFPAELQALTTGDSGLVTSPFPHIRRDSAYLSWRYAAPSFQWILLFEGEILRGWAVVQQDTSLLRNKVWVYELWGMPAISVASGIDVAESSPESRLMQAVLHWSRSLSVDVVEARATHPAWVNVLACLGFVARGPAERFIVHSRSSEQCSLLGGQPWALTLGDSGNG